MNACPSSVSDVPPLVKFVTEKQCRKTALVRTGNSRDPVNPSRTSVSECDLCIEDVEQTTQRSNGRRRVWPSEHRGNSGEQKVSLFKRSGSNRDDRRLRDYLRGSSELQTHNRSDELCLSVSRCCHPKCAVVTPLVTVRAVFIPLPEEEFLILPKSERLPVEVTIGKNQILVNPFDGYSAI